MRALILADIQNDFLPGGALAVSHGDEVVPVANRLMPCFEVVVASRDWHPRNHGSFASRHKGRKVGDVVELAGRPQALWPDHCVQDTPGAELAPGLNRAGIHWVVDKGMDPDRDSYSAFLDNGRRHYTGLAAYLRQRGVTDVYVMGLTTDYCVKNTALDAVWLGFRTYLVIDGTRGINVQSGDVERAIAAMRAAGVKMVTGENVIAECGLRIAD